MFMVTTNTSVKHAIYLIEKRIESGSYTIVKARDMLYGILLLLEDTPCTKDNEKIEMLEIVNNKILELSLKFNHKG